MAMDTTVDVDRPCQVTLIAASPRVKLGVRVTVASPEELVMPVEEERIPMLVAKLSKALGTGTPLSVSTVVIVEFIVEPAAIVCGIGVSDRSPEAMVTGVVCV